MKKLAALVIVALASVALVACGSSSSTTTTTTGGEAGESTGGEAGAAAEGGESTGGEAGAAAEGGESTGGEAGAAAEGGGSTVSLEADPGGQITYTRKTATAKAGSVTIEFKNPQPLSHDVAIEGSGGERIGKTSLIAESQTSTTVSLKPGKYTFYCTVPGHREAGMEGTLTVK